MTVWGSENTRRKGDGVTKPGLDHDAALLRRALVGQERVTSRVLEHLTDTLACPCRTLEVLLRVDLLRYSNALRVCSNKRKWDENVIRTEGDD